MQAATEKQELEPYCQKTRLTLGGTPSTKRHPQGGRHVCGGQPTAGPCGRLISFAPRRELGMMKGGYEHTSQSRHSRFVYEGSKAQIHLRAPRKLFTQLRSRAHCDRP